MPRKPHFVLAARRWGWPLSPSYGRVRGLMTSVMGWKPKAETASCGSVHDSPAALGAGRPGPGESTPVPVAEDRPDVL